MEGDAGAPVLLEEVEKLEEALEVIAPEMTPEARAIVDEQGVVYNDRDGDLVTSIVNGKDCVFASRDENGGCICLIEKAYREGRTPWRKPISCYLYPVRLRKVGDFTAVNFHKWDVCNSAFIKGRRKGIRAYEFLKEPLIERFGKAVQSLQPSAPGAQIIAGEILNGNPNEKKLKAFAEKYL